TVWEELIVNAPRDVVLVALSATVPNVAEIADWISLVHRPITPISHPHRPVPLSYAVADLAGDIHAFDQVRAGQARVIGDERRSGDDRGRWYTRRVVDPNVLIEALEARGWLPAIYFIFSRVGCERAMDDVLTEGRALIGRAQQSLVDEAIGEAVAESPSIGDSELNQTVFRALRLGVGIHHAGILPSLKRLIERLFERGLCRVVFATETMSLGIHMPARAVVLQGLTKRTERGFRSLSHNELTQMAGRAGRRGIDAEGQCVIALDVRDGLEDVVRVVDGAPEPIESQFKLGYGSVASLLATGAEPEALRRRVEASFGQYQNLTRVREVEADVQRPRPRGGRRPPAGDGSRGPARRARRGGSRVGAAHARPAPGRAQPGHGPRHPLDPRPPRARGRAAASGSRRPAQGGGHQADPLGHAAVRRPSRSAPILARPGRGAARASPPGRPASGARRGRARRARARPEPRAGVEHDRMPPLPVGIHDAL
ncbi:MAG: hypothetical protein HYS77_17535, partial [Candidatus Rokubacteria bacterium]|nr:hypothetical protein [Candidatus Rokubacteria bacterium]